MQKEPKNEEEYTGKRLRNGQCPPVHCGTTEPGPATLLPNYGARQQGPRAFDGPGISNGGPEDISVCYTKWLRLSHNDGVDGAHDGRQRM